MDRPTYGCKINGLRNGWLFQCLNFTVSEIFVKPKVFYRRTVIKGKLTVKLLMEIVCSARGWRERESKGHINLNKTGEGTEKVHGEGKKKTEQRARR